MSTITIASPSSRSTWGRSSGWDGSTRSATAAPRSPSSSATTSRGWAWARSCSSTWRPRPVRAGWSGSSPRCSRPTPGCSTTFREAGYAVEQHREEDVLAVSFDSSPTVDSRAVMAAREHRAEARSVQRLLQPRSVAVVGASRSPGGLGHRILQAIVAGGFTGTVVAVHPEVGRDRRGAVRAIPERASTASVDLAVVVGSGGLRGRRHGRCGRRRGPRPRRRVGRLRRRR